MAEVKKELSESVYLAAPGSVEWVETSTGQQSEPLYHNYEALNVITEKEMTHFHWTPLDNKYNNIQD